MRRKEGRRRRRRMKSAPGSCLNLVVRRPWPNFNK
jgi:hypothetical protein